MATVKVVIHRDKIRHLLSQTQSELKTSLQKAMSPSGIIHDQTPVDTGALRRRVNQRVSGIGSGDILIQAFWEMPYAEILELAPLGRFTAHTPSTRIPWAVRGMIQWATSLEFGGAVGKGFKDG